MVEDRIPKLEALIEIDPDDADLPFLLGKALLDAGRYDEAARKLEQAVRMNPRLAAIHRYWGEALREAGDTEAARVVWTDGAELSEQTGDLEAGKVMRVFLKRLGSS